MIKYFKNPKNIFRIICVAKNYDENFLDRESLEKLMTEKLQSDLKIDLLIKEPNGYSVLWISEQLFICKPSFNGPRTSAKLC